MPLPATLSNVHGRGTRAAQPDPADVPVGAIYCVTDEGNIQERSTGLAWESYSSVGLTEVDLAWDKKFFVDEGLLPATERVAADLSSIVTPTTWTGTYTAGVGHSRFAVPTGVYWDLGAARSTVLVVGTIQHADSNMYFGLSSGVPSGDADSWRWYQEGASGNYRFQRVVSAAYTQLGADPAGLPTVTHPVGMAFHYDDATNRLRGFVRQGAGGWFLVTDTTDTQWTTVRYVLVRKDGGSGIGRLFSPFTAWSD